MGFMERARASCVAIGLGCAGCHFDTGPLPVPDDLAPATVTSGSRGPSGAEQAPTAVPPASSGAQTGAGAAGAAAPDPGGATGAPPASQAGSGASDGDDAPSAQDAAADPTAEAPDANAAPMQPDAGAAPPSGPSSDPSDAATPDPEPPVPGALFSPCSSNTDCSDGRVCTSTIPSQSGFTGQPGYCAEFCTWNNGNPAASCTQPENGLVKASCQLNGVCLLGSCDRSVCPDGLRCAETETPIGGGQVVTFYVCQS